MPFTCHISLARKLAYMRGTGTLEVTEVTQAGEAVVRAMGMEPSLRQLVVLEVTKSTVHYAEWNRYLDMHAPHPTDRKMALVAVSSFAFGVARQFSQVFQRDGLNIQVFRELASALAWLDITEDDIQACVASPDFP